MGGGGANLLGGLHVDVIARVHAHERDAAVGVLVVDGGVDRDGVV